jgi:hypothetical protein
MANANLDFSGLSVTRTFTFPDATGTIVLDAGSANIVTVGTITTGVWHGTAIGVQWGGTGANLSATGGTSQVVMQTSSGGAFTVAQLAVADLSTAKTGTGSIVLATAPTFASTITVTTNAIVTGKVLTTAGLGVGNSATAATPGTVVKKIEVFDASGVSLGFIAVYDAIT